MSSRLIAAFVENLQMTVLGEPQPFGAPPALPIESDEDPPEPKFEKVTELRSRSERPAPKLEPAGTHPLMVRPSGQRELLARRLAPYLSRLLAASPAPVRRYDSESLAGQPLNLSASPTP
jgi:hypothetical protein